MASDPTEPRWRQFLTDAERVRLAEIAALEAAIQPDLAEARRIANAAAKRAARSKPTPS